MGGGTALIKQATARSGAFNDDHTKSKEQKDCEMHEEEKEEESKKPAAE